MSSQIVSARLGPNGITYKARDEAVAEFKRDMAKAAIDQFVVRDDAEIERRLHEQNAARRRFSEARYYKWRDASHQAEDIRADPRNRHKRFSFTRDMINGPAQDVSVYNLGRGFNSRSVGTVGHDRYRFAREADALRMMRVIDEREIPDWHSDEEILEFFSKVYDMALQEAKDFSRTGVKRIFDNAPGIYLFTELLKRSEKLIEEDFTQFWARAIFPIMDLNTWLPQWMYERIDDRSVFPQTVDIEFLPSAAPRSETNRAPVPRPLIYWHHAASWSNLELLRYAEAVANGAANIQLDQRRINIAIRMMNWFEDVLAFFGSTAHDIHGLFSPEDDTGIERIPSGGGFSSGTTEVDRELLTRETKLIINNTEQALAPNTILLGTSSWTYVNDKRYGNLAADSNQTVLEAAEATLRKLGIEEILWVPEVGFRQDQQDRLEQHGVPTAEAERLAGGLDGEQCMVTMRRDPEVAEMVVAKNRVMYPARETVNDRVEARMLQGGGGMVFYKPEAIKITTDVGP